MRVWLVFGLLFTSAPSLSAADDKAAGSGLDARLEFNVRVPMRDGVTLSADVYRPVAEGKYPVILLRTPYNKVGDARSAARLKAIASRGYVVVNQDVRGRGDSGGVYEPWRREGLDGYDTIE
jgi:predicted acyl esterase